MTICNTVVATATAFAVLLSASNALATDPRWGLVANSGTPVPIKATYFFPGDSLVGVPVNEQNSIPGPNYTFDPADWQNIVWTSGDEAALGIVGGARCPVAQMNCARKFVLDQMESIGLNIISMSYWADSPPSSPMQWSYSAIDGVFNEAVGRNIKILPAVEVLADGNFAGRWSLPDNDPHNLAIAIEDVVIRYLTDPTENSWPNTWAKIYDQNGEPRYAIQIQGIASSTQPTDGPGMVDFLDGLATKVATDTHLNGKIGFIINTTFADAFTPTPTNTDFGASAAILGYQGFLNEFNNSSPRVFGHPYCDNNGLAPSAPCNVANIDQIATQKREVLLAWHQAGLPVILDVDPGYDGRYVFADSPIGSGVWGDNSAYYDDDWRNYQSEMKGVIGNAGIVFNSWNGYTEGMTAVPAVRVVSADGAITGDSTTYVDVRLNWLRDLLAPDPRACSHTHYVNGGATKYSVYGAICEEWNRASGVSLPNAPPSIGFGAPIISSEGDTPNHANTGGRVNYFSLSGDERAVYWSPATDNGTGAHAVYGAIYQKYKQMNNGVNSQDLSYLQMPLTTELDTTAFCPGGRYVQFQGGWIDFCPAGLPAPYNLYEGVWAHSDPNQGPPGRDL